MKELQRTFIGKGEVRGRENTRHHCVSYPSAKSFGIWAWTFSGYQEAINRLNLLAEMAN